MISWDPYSSNTVLMLSSSKLKSDVLVVTQNKHYGNMNQPNGQDIDKPKILEPKRTPKIYNNSTDTYDMALKLNWLTDMIKMNIHTKN